MVSPLHVANFVAARPTTQTVDLESGPNEFVHGTVSDAGAGKYASAIGAFADRAVAARDAERNGARLGCSGVGRSVTEIGLIALKSSLRCLATRDMTSRAAASGTWQQTKVTMRGEVNAARIWASLRTTRSGRRALAAAAKRRAKMTVSQGDRSRIILRATR
jgi:hypothetical protein